MSADRPLLAEFERDWQHIGFLAAPELTFPQVFAAHARAFPDEIALTVVKPAGQDFEGRAFTYRALSAMAARAMRELSAGGVRREDRVIVSLESPESFLAYVLAAMGLGAVAVPVPGAGDFLRPAVFRERVKSIASNCRPRAIVVDAAAAWQPIADELGQSALINADPVALASSDEAYLPGTHAFDDIAFIQYTSGSTGQPKGVLIDHYNLVDNIRAICEAAQFGPTDRSFCWLPLYHDMGLVGGLLSVIYMRIPAFLMAPKHFVRRPESWLRAISQYRITYCAGPNFAYSVLSRRGAKESFEGIDLSSWRLAFNGSEPVDCATVERFSARFASRGLRNTSVFPVYGMAECTLAAAFPIPGELPHFDSVDRETLMASGRAVPVPRHSPGAATFTSVGRALPGHRIRILALDGDRELEARCVGEVAIYGPSVSRGYFGGAQAPAIRELRTGDLGYMADGHLFILDRLKDLIIIAGRNLVPSDIEQLVGTVEGVAGTVIAMGLRGEEETEELCIVASIRPCAREQEEIRADIRRIIYEHFAVIPRDICFVSPGAIPKTSSGKAQRAVCKQLYQAGTLIQ